MRGEGRKQRSRWARYAGKDEGRTTSLGRSREGSKPRGKKGQQVWACSAPGNWLAVTGPATWATGLWPGPRGLGCWAYGLGLILGHLGRNLKPKGMGLKPNRKKDKN